MKTGNKELDLWIKFFSSDEKSMSKFVKYVKKNDKTFLTKGFPQDVDDENLFPLNGLLEEDFLKCLKNEKEIKDCYTRLVLSVVYGVQFDSWKEIYSEKIKDVFENALIEGSYEKFDIQFEKIITIFIQKDLINKKNFMAISLLRGMYLAKDYSTEEAKKNLEKEIKKNKWKIRLSL
jgi:hypothetical protein